jgi:hypothetical protein
LTDDAICDLYEYDGSAICRRKIALRHDVFRTAQLGGQQGKGLPIGAFIGEQGIVNVAEAIFTTG